MDTESNSFFHYPEQLCLVQIGTREHVFIIDPIALGSLSPLKDILADPTVPKLMHAADNDIRNIHRHYGLNFRNIYDTQIAARFAGLSQVGLASLLQELLGITITKRKSLQRSDWARRPLSAEAIDYAASDVRHLPELKEELDARLRALGRTEWAAEECERLEAIRYTDRDVNDGFLDVKGAHHLDGRGLAVLRSLFIFREKQARLQHKPPHFIMSDDVLVGLAMNPNADLASFPGLGQSRMAFFSGVRGALNEGMSAAPICRARCPENRRPGEEQIRRLKSLKAWRTSAASKLNLDPPLIWPTASLERLARTPETIEQETACREVRDWQREQFASSLRAFVRAGMHTLGPTVPGVQPVSQPAS